jgi:peroxiredoxin
MLRRTALFLGLAVLCSAALPPGGTPLPDVPIPQPGGGKIDLKKYRGKALVLALISTECADCALTVDLLNKLQEENASQGLQVVVAAGDEHAAAELFFYEKQHRPKYPMGYLDQPSFIKIAGLLPTDHPFVPILMFIDPKGIIRVKLKGDDPLMKKRDATIRSTIRELLKEPGIKP